MQTLKNIFRPNIRFNLSEVFRKMPRLFLCLSLLVGIVSGHSQTVSQWESMQLQDARGKIELKRPKSWEYLQGAFGLTHLFVTHPKVKKRTSISVTVTGIDNLDFGTQAGERDYPQYQEGRLRWATKKGATISQFEPYSFAKNNHSNLIHKGGVAYSYSGSDYQEFSYFIMCTGKKSNLIHLKSVSRDRPETIRPIMDEMAADLKCL